MHTKYIFSLLLINMLCGETLLNAAADKQRGNEYSDPVDRRLEEADKAMQGLAHIDSNKSTALKRLRSEGVAIVRKLATGQQLNQADVIEALQNIQPLEVAQNRTDAVKTALQELAALAPLTQPFSSAFLEQEIARLVKVSPKAAASLQKECRKIQTYLPDAMSRIWDSKHSLLIKFHLFSLAHTRGQELERERRDSELAARLQYTPTIINIIPEAGSGFALLMGKPLQKHEESKS